MAKHFSAKSDCPLAGRPQCFRTCFLRRPVLLGLIWVCLLGDPNKIFPFGFPLNKKVPSTKTSICAKPQLKLFPHWKAGTPLLRAAWSSSSRFPSPGLWGLDKMRSKWAKLKIRAISTSTLRQLATSPLLHGAAFHTGQSGSLESAGGLGKIGCDSHGVLAPVKGNPTNNMLYQNTRKVSLWKRFGGR